MQITNYSQNNKRGHTMSVILQIDFALLLPFINESKYSLIFSAFSPELCYTSSAGVPSTPDPPSLVQATASSLQLTWKKPNTNGGTCCVNT